MSPYDGRVRPGGPAISRVVNAGGARVEVRKFSVGQLDNNVYLLRDTGSDEGLLIDAATDAPRILQEIDGVDLPAVLTTHGHGDHWQALNEIVTTTGASVWLHPGDAAMVPRRADHPVADGDTLQFGAARVRVLHTPGHTPGSTCVLLGETHLFTGDTLFPGGPGRTTNPADFKTIMESLRERLFLLSDETWVYPGHGDDTTLGAERPHLDEWQQRGW